MVTVYRTGRPATAEKIANRNAVWFDNLTPVPEGCSPRSESVFAALTYEEAVEWVEWRLDAKLDASIWAITIPDETKIYAHPVQSYETARFTQTLTETGELIANDLPAYSAEKYWENRVLITETTELPKGDFWEILVPLQTATTAQWELVEYVTDDYREKVPTYFD